VHREAERHERTGRQILLIGHAGHPEVIGTMGQVPAGAILLIEDIEAAETVEVEDPGNLAYITQTTLSVDDTSEIIAVLKRRFPSIHVPKKEDICYATTNRQEAVKEIARRCDALLVVGAPNSSNSQRLVEVARREGCRRAILVQRAADIDWASLAGIRSLGITAGASAPEVLVEEVVAACRLRFNVRVENVSGVVEDVIFKLPKELTVKAATA
jgi:4-hydroxy-3-methylbut-2-en-1-yl diphosphate reductase